MSAPKSTRASVTSSSHNGASQGLGVSLIASPELIESIADAVAARLVDALPAAPAADGYLDVDGAATFISAPKSRIYDLVQLDRLTPLRDGRRLLFRRSDLVAYIEGEGSE